MLEFSQLIKPGIAGFYNSCQVTIIAQFDRSQKSSTLLFAQLLFSECAFESTVAKIDKLKTKGNIGYSVTQYSIPIEFAQNIYENLASNNIWSDPLQLNIITEKKYKQLPCKYTSAYIGNRENGFLAPNETGSYWLEFFNESKQSVTSAYEPYKEGIAEEVINTVKEKYRIDLFRVRDRIGNIVFQFPVNQLQVKVNSIANEKKIELHILWHQELKKAPPCYIQLESSEETSITEFRIIPYNGEECVVIPVNEYNISLRVRICRIDTGKLLFEWKCDCAAITNIIGTMSLDIPTVRKLTLNGNKHDVTLHFPNAAFNPLDYREHAKITISRLKTIRPYRQFEAGQREDALEYIRGIIKENRSREILVIDPYLKGDDLLNTVYFCPQFGRRIRAIGSAAPHYHKSLESLEQVEQVKNKRISHAQGRIEQQRLFFSNLPGISNLGINLECRFDYGDSGIGELHDRFILFPGNASESQPPKAISIGTSINAVGKSSHVIGAFEDPQGIIDDFEHKWYLLRDPKYLIYKRHL